MALGVLLCAVAIFALTRHSPKVMHTWPKAPAALYGQDVFLTVFESGRDWRGFPLAVEPTYAIYVGRDAGTPSYGHEMPFQFYGYDVPAEIQASVVAWSEDGVSFTAPSGHRLFIPKAMFLGGR
jgi:hypothetical protein